MIKNLDLWRRWEDNYHRSETVNVTANLQVLNAMYEEAIRLNAFSSLDPLEGLETKINLAKTVNVRTTS
jgi:hypothetical protein